MDFIAPMRVLGSVSDHITGASSLDKAEREHLAFFNLRGEDAIRKMSASGAGVIICRDDVPGLEKAALTKCIVTVENPRLAFIRCLKRFFNQRYCHCERSEVIYIIATSPPFPQPMIFPRVEIFVGWL